MAGIPGQMAPGLESLQGNVRRINPLEFATIDKLNERFINVLANDARARKRAFRNSTDADAVHAIDQKETVYKTAFSEFWSKQGLAVDAHSPEADAAWRKVRAKAVDEFVKAPDAALVTEEKPMPEPPRPPQEDVEPEIVVEADEMPLPPAPPAGREVPAEASSERTPRPPQERLDSLIDSVKWGQWRPDAAAVDPEDPLYLEFYAEFVSDLASALERMSDDPAVRRMEMNHAENVFKGKLMDMYLKQYYPEGATSEQRREATGNTDVQASFDIAWGRALADAERHTDSAATQTTELGDQSDLGGSKPTFTQWFMEQVGKTPAQGEKPVGEMSWSERRKAYLRSIGEEG